MKNIYLIGLLLASLGFNAFQYFNKPAVSEPYRMEGDTRESIVLNDANRHFVMNEMRGFVKSMQEIHDGIMNNDPEIIAKAAKVSGTGTKSPQELREALPKEFLQMGMKTHKIFEAIADSVNSDYKSQIVQKQMGQLYNQCVQCHNTYRFDAR